MSSKKQSSILSDSGYPHQRLRLSPNEHKARKHKQISMIHKQGQVGFSYYVIKVNMYINYRALMAVNVSSVFRI